MWNTFQGLIYQAAAVGWDDTSYVVRLVSPPPKWWHNYVSVCSYASDVTQTLASPLLSAYATADLDSERSDSTGNVDSTDFYIKCLRLLTWQRRTFLEPKGGDALRLGSKGRQCQAWCNLQVKLCDPCLSALKLVTTMRYTNRRILTLLHLSDSRALPLLLSRYSFSILLRVGSWVGLSGYLHAKNTSANGHLSQY